MTLFTLLMAMLWTAPSIPERLRFVRTILSGGLSDAELLVLLPFGLAGIVTALLFGVQWVVQAFDREDRSS